MKAFYMICAAATVAGCANGPEWLQPRGATSDAQPEPSATTTAAVKPPARARTADEFDTSSAADKAAAQEPSTGGTDLGVTIASLGAPGEPGFWLKTPLVKTAGPGRVVYPANGKSVKVDLIPIEGDAGAGSRMSLAALRVLDAPLAGLPEVKVTSLK